jgi:hypothetical protein
MTVEVSEENVAGKKGQHGQLKSERDDGGM